MRVLGWVVVAVLVVAGLVSLDPAVVGLSETTPVLQAVALRGWLALGGLGLGLLLVLTSVLLRRSAGKGRRLLVVGIVAALVGLGHGGVLLERGTSSAASLGTKSDDAVDVLTLNTQGSAGGTAAVVGLVDELDPDVVALQEITPEDAATVAAGVAGDYRLFTRTTGPQPVQGSALLVSGALGAYEQAQAPATTFGGVWARPVDGTGPELLSVHTVPPTPDAADVWRDELDALVGLCERVDRVVLAGDLNATVDHASVRDAACVDGTVAAGGLGTWPATWHPLLGTAIDHVLVDAAAWQAVSARVLDAPGAGDHRALLVRIIPAT